MKKIKLVLCSLLLSICVQAHNSGNISGVVFDSKTHQAMVGVTIGIKGTLIGANSDLKGKFTLRNLKVGTYTLTASFVGYKTYEQNVEVKEGQTDSLVIQLEETATGIGEVTVEVMRPMTAASSKEIRALDMQLKPLRSSQDMLLMVPGLYIAQHQGGGKAEQIFLRGFDCDHGTDVAVSVDGMPVNMVTHAHGQGYADLHFLIAETVDDMEVHKGPYRADIGDFYTAGAVQFKTKDVLDNNLVKVEAGQFNTQKYTVLFQPTSAGVEQNAYCALQYNHSDGPFEHPSGFERMNAFAKYFFQITPQSKISFSAGGFTTGWNASGQLPERAIANGIIGRFGGLDNLEGGVTNRKNLQMHYTLLTPNGGEFEINSYVTQYNYKLFSNFSLFLNDPINGDMIEQTEHRNLLGASAGYRFATQWFGMRQLNRIGCGYRGDVIDVELWHAPNRNRMNVFTNDNIDEQSLNTWLQQEWMFSPLLRMVWGVRHDYYTFSKDDKVGDALDTINNGLPHASGVAFQSVFSPKVSFIISPVRNLDIFLNAGQGFHSNDARDAVLGTKVKELASTWQQEGLSTEAIDQRLQRYNFSSGMRTTGTLPKATAGEVGLKTRLFKRLHISFAAWYLYLDKEFVYTGDGGTTEINNPTQRMGVDVETRLSITPWLWIDADVSQSKGTIKNLPAGENYIPLAPNFIASGGISMIREHGIGATLRVRHLGNRPANEDNSVVAFGHTLLNAGLSYRLQKWTLMINLENILNTTWNEAQFATETRLKGEASGVTDLCLTPGNPRNVQCGIQYKF